MNERNRHERHDHKSWNANGSKDTFWNLAVLICGLLILIVGVIDVPHEAPNQVAARCASADKCVQ